MTFGAEDVTLVAARSAEEGFALARQLQPELVIADGMMPGRSGYDLCAQIKADPSLSSTAVYVLASAQQPYDDSRGRQCGADGHLMKPFDTTAIIERVQEALAKGPTEVAQPVSAQPTSTSAPLSDDFGPPMPDMRSGIPHGLTIAPLAAASDDDEYGEISVDMSPPTPEEEAPRGRVAAAPPLAASRPSLTPPPYAPSAGTPSPSFQAPAASFEAYAPAGASVPAAASMRPSLDSRDPPGRGRSRPARRRASASRDSEPHSRGTAPGAGRAHADGLAGGERSDPRNVTSHGAADGAADPATDVDVHARAGARLDARRRPRRRRHPWRARFPWLRPRRRRRRCFRPCRRRRRRRCPRSPPRRASPRWCQLQSAPRWIRRSPRSVRAGPSTKRSRSCRARSSSRSSGKWCPSSPR